MINTAAKAVLSRVLPGFNFLMGTEAEPQLIINALHAVTDVKILIQSVLGGRRQSTCDLASRRSNSGDDPIRSIRDRARRAGRE